MIKRLQRKFIRIAMLSVAAVMAALCLIVNAAYYIYVDNELSDMLHMIADNRGSIPAAQDSRPPEPGADGRRTDGPFTVETPYSTRYFVLRYDDAGELSEMKLDYIASVDGDNVERYLTAAAANGEGMGYIDSYKYYVVHNGDDRNMAVFLDCYQEQRTLRAVAAVSVLASAVCIAVVYVLVCLLSKKAVEPFIESSQRQKQFITDASHELKTPLAVMTTGLSVLELEVGENKWTAMLKAQTEKLGRLVCALVTLSRMDEEKPKLNVETFDLSAAVGDTAEAFAAHAESAGHALDVSIAPAVKCRGDEALIRQLCSVLLDNAVKYALPGSAVSLTLAQERGSAVLRCANECEPISNEDMKHLFDRFYRPDKSRTSSTGGFGVGLSIARSIAEAHGGTITASAPRPGMIEFTVALKC